MCGICGILMFNNSWHVEPRRVSQMTRTMKHRGPDDTGIRTGGNWGLGHRRLSIIDITGGRQPMTLEDEGLTIVFNGEIYNYLELKNELIHSGRRFNTKSDTEVVLQAFNQWGTSCVDKLRGMFSFALWDEKAQKLFLCRDRMGIKPLYIFQNSDFLIFGSEVKSIFASELVKSEAEEGALDSFLSLGYVPAPITMFRDVRKLLPGHWMYIDAKGRAKTKCYWNFDRIKTDHISFFDAQKKLMALLRESVKMRLMSEVPLGVFLSGGLDSSAITALICQVSEQQVKTFSVGFKGHVNDGEIVFSRKIAELFGTEHHEYTLKPYDFLDSIPQMVQMLEEPLVETPAIPLYLISKMAKEHATVLLSGEGSDEIFAGYGLYEKMVKLEKLCSGFRFLRHCPTDFLPGDRNKKYLDWISNPLSERYRGTSADMTDRIRNTFYSREFLQYLGENRYLEDTFHRWFKDIRHRDALAQMLYVDSKTWLPDDLLLKADKTTMAASVELRVPFLDHKIVEFAASLPAHFKLYKGQGKYILKKVMETYLPRDIIYRKKMGFTVPTQKWFAGDLLGPARDIIFSKRIMDTGFFRNSYLETMFERHEKGKEDYSRRIFSLLVLYHWLDIYT